MDADLDYGRSEDEARLVSAPDDLEMNEADANEASIEPTIVDGQLPGTKLYRLPVDEGVRVGAERGVQGRTVEDDELMGEADDVQLPEPPVPIGGALDIRLNVLHLSGSPITQCSTSRIFAYLTHHHAQPLGLEWIDDSSCNVVFAAPSAALLGIEYLCPASDLSTEPLVPLPRSDELESLLEVQNAHKAGSQADMDTDSSTGLVQSLLQPRLAHRVPGHLYTAVERETAAELASLSREPELPSDAPEIYRELEQEERSKRLERPEARKLGSLRGNLYVRFALESLDVKSSRASKQSQWYAEHGAQGGRDVVTKLLTVGAPGERLELLGGAESGAERGAANRARGRGSAGRTAVMDELDGELESYLAARDSEPSQEEAALPPSSRSGERRRARARNQAPMDRLDEEMDAWNRRERERSASPGRRGGLSNANGTGTVKIRGRGAMRAPRASAWGDDDAGVGDNDVFAHRVVPADVPLSGRMAADDLRDRGRRRRGGGGDRDMGGANGQGGSLFNRLGGEAGDDRRLADRLT